MVVYANRKRAADPAVLVRTWNQTRPHTADDWLQALIEAGEIEAGIADALSPDSDGLNPLLDEFRRSITDVAGRRWRAAPPAR